MNERGKNSEKKAKAFTGAANSSPEGERAWGAATGKIYVFGPFRLDLGRCRLYQNEKPVKLRPKAFDALVHLVTNPGRLLTKEEFMRRVWADCFVTDGVLTHTIAAIRKALQDGVRESQYVQTLPRRGYLWVSDLKILEPEDLSSSRAPEEAAPEPSQTPEFVPLCDRPASKGAGSAPDPGAHNFEPESLILQRRQRKRLYVWRASATLAVFALIGVAALLLVRFSAQRWTKSVSPPIAGSLAILPFEIHSDRPGLEWLSVGLADMFSTGLWSSPQLAIVGYRQFVPAGPAPSERPDLLSESQALEMARQARVERLITGSLIRLGPQIQLNAHLIRTADGFRQESFRARIRGPEEVFDAVDRICFQLLRTMALENSISGHGGRRLAETTTDSLDAYRHYVAGTQKMVEETEWRSDGALREFEEATRIDPSFAMAHLKIAELKERSRSWGLGHADPQEPLEQAIRSSEFLPEKERILIGALKAAVIDNLDEALALLKKLEQIYPSYALESGVPLKVASIHLKRGEVDSVIEYAEPLVVNTETHADVRARLSHYLATAFHRKGNFPEALSYARQSISLWPAQSNPFFALYMSKLGRIYLDASWTPEALKCFRQALEFAGQDAVNLTAVAWGFYLAGKTDVALELTEGALRINPNYGNAHHLRGWIYLSEGRYRQAAEELERAYADTTAEFGSVLHGLIDGDLAALYYSGVAYDRLGEKEKAASIFRTLLTACRRVRERWSREDPNSSRFVQAVSLEGLAYCRLGKVHNCRSIIERLAGSRRSDVDRYKHLARLHSVHGDKAAGLHWLAKAIAAGKREYRHILDDPDFDSLHELGGFHRLLQ